MGSIITHYWPPQLADGQVSFALLLCHSILRRWRCFLVALITWTRTLCNSCTCASVVSGAPVDAFSEPCWLDLVLDGPAVDNPAAERLSVALLSDSAIFACRALIMSWCASAPACMPGTMPRWLRNQQSLPQNCWQQVISLQVVDSVGCHCCVLLAADVDMVVDVGSSDVVKVKNTGQCSCEVLSSRCSSSLCLCFYRQKKA